MPLCSGPGVVRNTALAAGVYPLSKTLRKRRLLWMYHTRPAGGKESKMLVLSRKLGQVLHIGHDIRVTVQSIGLGQAVLRIDCPSEIVIWPPRANRTQVDGARIISRSVNETLLIGQHPVSKQSRHQ